MIAYVSCLKLAIGLFFAVLELWLFEQFLA